MRRFMRHRYFDPPTMLWPASSGFSMLISAAVSGVSIMMPWAPLGETASGFQWLS